MEPSNPTEIESRVLKAAVDKGLITAAMADEFMRRGTTETPATALLIQQGVLTKHIVESLAGGAAPGEPQAIGGFKIVGKLGQGGMGTVYRALQVSMNREVALKVISKQYASDPAFCDRFLREARAAGAVNHPNVITCFDVGQADGWLYMALELMTGGDAAGLAKKTGNRLDEARALRIIADCARGLMALKRAGLIHRDIKPANIFISEDGIAKLADLGLARSTSGDDRMTMTGAAMGTPAFMSPEQASGEATLDLRTDIYALGASMFALVTGDIPFKGASAFAVVAKVINDAVPDPRSLHSAVTDGCAAIILTAMAKDRDRRYANPEAMIEDIERVLTGRDPLHAHAPPRPGTQATWIASPGGNRQITSGVGTAPTSPASGVDHHLATMPTVVPGRAQAKATPSSGAAASAPVGSAAASGEQAQPKRRTKLALVAVLLVVAALSAFGIHRARRHQAHEGGAVVEAGVSASGPASPGIVTAVAPERTPPGRVVEVKPPEPVAIKRPEPVYADPEPVVPPEPVAVKRPEPVVEARPDPVRQPEPKPAAPVEPDPPPTVVVAKVVAKDPEPVAPVASPPVASPPVVSPPVARIPDPPPVVETPVEPPPVAKPAPPKPKPAAKPKPVVLDPAVSINARALLHDRKFIALVENAGDNTLAVQVDPAMKDLAGLRGLPVSRLECEGCTRLSGGLAALKGAPLHVLSLRGCTSLADLKGIEGLPLEALDLTNCESLEDLSPLKSIGVTELHLAGCRSIAALDGIAGMRLTTLDLTDCRKLPNILALKGMPLTQLCLLRCSRISSLDGVQGMPLTQLDLTLCEALTSLAPLKGLKLTRLGLEGCKRLPSLDGIQGMALGDLDLSRCSSLKGDLSALSGMRLKHLVMMRCDGVVSLNGLQGNQLGSLEITSCDALQGDLSALAGMPLKTLQLRNCPNLLSLEGLQGTPLKRLIVTECKRITDYTPVGAIPGLEIVKDK